jgi:hypothetical protein
VVVRCSPEEAFDYLVDLRNEREWNPDLESVEKLTDGPVGLGTQYRAKWRSAPRPLVVETIAYDRPRSWSGHNGGPVEVTLTARLTAVAEGTRLETEFNATPHGLFRLFFPLFVRKMRKVESANMGHIREILDGRAADRV